MKMRKILAASTAALLAFGTTAIVASASDPDGSTTLDAAGSWEDVAEIKSGSDVLAAIAYKQSANAKKVNGEWTISATNITNDCKDATAMVAEDAKLEGLKANSAKSLAGMTSASPATAMVFDLAVTQPDDEDDVARGDVALPAAIQLRVNGLGFKAAHVYHFEDKKLVELKSSLTQKTEGGETTYGIEFSTKTFSPFIISEDAIKGAVSLDSDDNPANDDSTADSDTSNGGSTTNPETGIALAIAPVVLAAGAVAVVALKKKH